MTAEPEIAFRGPDGRELHFDGPDGRHYVLRRSREYSALFDEAAALLIMLPPKEAEAWRERIVESCDDLSEHAVRIETFGTVALRAMPCPKMAAVLQVLRAVVDGRILAGLSDP